MQGLHIRTTQKGQGKAKQQVSRHYRHVAERQLGIPINYTTIDRRSFEEPSQLPPAQGWWLVSSSRSYNKPIDIGSGWGDRFRFAETRFAFKFFPLTAMLLAALRSAFISYPHALHAKASPFRLAFSQ